MKRLATLALAVMLVGLQYRLWVADGGISHTYRLKTETAYQRAENGQFKARNAALEAEIGDLKSGVGATEGLARTELGMIKQGETFYLVVRP